MVARRPPYRVHVKSFGDAFVVDVATKVIRLLTHYPSAGYLRVQYLPNGDYLLIGARTFTDIRTTRGRDQEMWILEANGSGQPVPLEHKISEGVAISRRTSRIAWSNTHGQYPDLLAEGESVLYTADIVKDGGAPRLVNKKEIMRAKAPECTLEAQDFRNEDAELIYTCYRTPFADVFGVDLGSGKVTTYRKLSGEYNEVEGIFPDGEYTLVESSRDQLQQNSSYIDIWKLKLEPDSLDFVRVTRWGEYEGFKASNPVVSPDAKTIAFQSARSRDPAGVGLWDLPVETRLNARCIRWSRRPRTRRAAGSPRARGACTARWGRGRVRRARRRPSRRPARRTA